MQRPCDGLCALVIHATRNPGIYTLSLHDALPICQYADARRENARSYWAAFAFWGETWALPLSACASPSRFAQHQLQRKSRSEEHTSELQSHHELVCRLLLEKKTSNAKHFSIILST